MHVANREDWLIILGVLLAFISLYGSAIFIIGRFVLSPKNRRPAIGLAGWLVFAACAFGCGCIWYAAFVEPNHFEVNEITVPMAGLKQPITLLQISDLHCDPEERLESKIAEKIEEIKPNVIAFTGDAVNSAAALPNFDKFANRVAKIAPVYAVKGDWDFAVGPQVYENTGWQVLSGTNKVLDINGARLCLIGVDSGAKCAKAVTEAPKGVPTILLFHNPDADVILNKQTDGINLYLCGHTHGGQIALPYYGALITQSVQGKKYESGLHKLNEMYLYTNRGIGMEGHFPRLRFFAKPEITIFHLAPVTGFAPRP